MKTQFKLVRGDITKRCVDAIVNAANAALSGGGGVDGAIHRAGGAAILQECRLIVGGCPVGSAVMTTAGKLPAQKVIHAVGPVWWDGSRQEAELLRSTYQKSLELAQAEGLKSIAFPSISTGAYRYPIDQASAIAFETVQDFCREYPNSIDLVEFVVFSKADEAVYQKIMSSIGA